jgi:hypothetical protein
MGDAWESAIHSPCPLCCSLNELIDFGWCTSMGIRSAARELRPVRG